MIRSKLVGVGVLHHTYVTLHHRSPQTGFQHRFRNTSDVSAIVLAPSGLSIASCRYAHYTNSVQARSSRSLCKSTPSSHSTQIFYLGISKSQSSPTLLCLSNPRQDHPEQGFISSATRVYFQTPKQSSVGSWSIAVFITCVVGAAVLCSDPSSDVGRFIVQPSDKDKTFVRRRRIEGQRSEGQQNMTDEALPGRPGTLTTQEEEKLREFWIATLQVFGVFDSQQAEDLAGEANVEVLRTETGVSKKTKKKKLGFLRRKHNDDDSGSTASAESGSRTLPSSADADDKYGQTKEFHEALASLSPASLKATFWTMVKHDHPDALQLRFLRARKWDVEKALVMMVSTMRWRAVDMHVDDDIMRNGELAALDSANGSDLTKKRFAEDFLTQIRMGKSLLHGLDKVGRPMCFVRVRLHKQGDQSEASLERYTVFIIESARLILPPPVDTACVVFDMTGFSMANMDYTPLKFMIKCFEANYPESLGVVLVHKAPWVFQGIWKIIKGWLDPVVASKVHFTNNNEEMAEYVPESQIIKDLGGQEDWNYQYIEPVPGENDTMKDTESRDKMLAAREKLVEDYEKATIDWIHDTSTNSTEIKTRRNVIAEKLRENYWRLDPYVRARSYYDRVGMINPGGRLQFYPAKNEVPNGSHEVATSAADVD